MKLIILAAAVTFGGAAAAQTTEPQSPGVMEAVGQAVECAGVKVVKADNRFPERDARGHVVRSDDALAPNCYNEPPRRYDPMRPAEPIPGPQDSGEPNLPECTKLVTDNCRQTYDPGRRR